MNPNPEILRRELLAARYLRAVESDDFDLQGSLWQLAEAEPELADLFQQVHDDLIAEQDAAETANVRAGIVDAVEKHLPSATVVRDPSGPVTFADVADELFRNPPIGLSNDAFRLNDELRSSGEPLPAELGLTALIAFAEAKFGAAPREYWRAFKLAALEVRMRANSRTAEYQLAARREPKPEDRP